MKSILLLETAKIVTITDHLTVTSDYDDAIINIATDAKVISGSANLPVGMTFTIRNTGADGNNIITFSPESTAKVVGSLKRRQGTNANATSLVD